MSQNTLQVENLRKVFVLPTAAGTEDFVAVEGASFVVPRGECLAIVGESGSGKSTIARMIAGLETPTRGDVLIDGHPRPPLPWPRNDRSRLARQIQMVHQDPNSSLNPRQTVRASLDEVLRHHAPEHDGPWRSQRVDELLAHVGLNERHRDVHPWRLSGGEKQRVAIARALAVQPQLLILDEAVSALDVSVQAHVLNLLRELRERLGLTYLFISHDLGVVRQVSDTAIVMRRGHVVEAGPTQQILDTPTHQYTRALLEAVPRRGWKPMRRATHTTHATSAQDGVLPPAAAER